MPPKQKLLISNTYKRVARWQAFSRVPSSYLPVQWRPWILDRGSLTKRLVSAAQGEFRVRVVSQAWQKPSADEAQALGLKVGQLTLVREVELCGHGQVWVRARSLIPAATLSGEERQLKYLAERPLGAFLFSSRAMRRQALELACFKDEYAQRFYARRSIFMLHNKPLLVSEYFMPALLGASAK